MRFYRRRVFKKGLLELEGSRRERSSLIKLDQNLRITLSSGSSIIWSIYFLSICAGGWVFGISSSSKKVNSSHLSSFGVKTVGLSPSICSKILSCEFEGNGLKNWAFKFIDMVWNRHKI